MLVRVPCSTSNLGSGIDCLGVALDRYLRVSASVAERTRFTFGSGFAAPIPDGDNLFLAAARRVCEMADKPLSPMHVHMETQIPTARGLGSSATAIVAGVLFANEALHCGMTTSELVDIATGLEGHPDNVTPCLTGGFTVAMQQDGHVAYARCTLGKELAFVAAVPDFTLSTEAARAVLPTSIPLCDAVGQLQRACLLTAALSRGAWRLLGGAMRDAVFTPARKGMIPGFDSVCEAAMAQGALGVMLSGAGPTVIAVALDRREAIAAAMQQAFLQHGVLADTAILSADNEGAIVEAGCEA